MNIHFVFELGRLRAQYDILGDQLHRLEEQHGVAPNIEREGGGGGGGQNDARQNRGGGGGGGGQNEARQNRGGGGGGGGENLIEELGHLHLDDQAINNVRAAIHDNETREIERGTAGIQLERRRQRARGAQQEQRLEQLNLEKDAVEIERRDIEIANRERELETARVQLQAERAMRRN